MLQKAVDIHFDLNYRHLCTSTDEKSGKKDEAKDDKVDNGNVKKEEVMQSSLVDETMQS